MFCKFGAEVLNVFVGKVPVCGLHNVERRAERVGGGGFKVFASCLHDWMRADVGAREGNPRWQGTHCFAAGCQKGCAVGLAVGLIVFAEFGDERCAEFRRFS